MKWKAIIEQEELVVESGQNTTLVNGQPLVCDLKQISGKHYSVLFNNQSHQMELVSVNQATKQLTIKLNGKLANIQLKDKMDLLLEDLGLANQGAELVNDLLAPMPGKVLEVLVQSGDNVTKGQKLLVLEAMKMENVLKASIDGKIASVKVAAGENVEKNQMLISFQ